MVKTPNQAYGKFFTCIIFIYWIVGKYTRSVSFVLKIYYFCLNLAPAQVQMPLNKPPSTPVSINKAKTFPFNGKTCAIRLGSVLGCCISSKNADITQSKKPAINPVRKLDFKGIFNTKATSPKATPIAYQGK